MGAFTRRGFVLSAAGLVGSHADSSGDVPWTVAELLQPPDLAARLGGAEIPAILCVAFPVLYRQRHIAGAILSGPTSKPEGLAALDAALQTLAIQNEIVLYCGGCPMDRCPNIRPAYRAAKARGFKRVRVLDLPTNFHTDWVARGFPSET